jgi:hypothetical protein
VIAGPVLAGDGATAHRQEGPGLAPVCVPLLPVLEQSVPADVDGDRIRSCDVITSAVDWLSFCADNGLVCDPYPDEFFADWSMLAVTIESVSPVVCENAGAVPGWELDCVRVSRHRARARVSLTLAGHQCQCTLNPQVPSLVYLVHAVAGDPPSSCRAWREVHTVECLGVLPAR